MSEDPRTQGGIPSEFSQLVIMIATSALQQLGQMADPSGKPEVNLQGAQGMIDMLDMLSAKTKGNLDADEQKMLTESLTMLRLHYVEVARTQTGTPTRPPPPEQASAEPPEVKTETTTADSESKTKYRKTYG